MNKKLLGIKKFVNSDYPLYIWVYVFMCFFASLFFPCMALSVFLEIVMFIMLPLASFGASLKSENAKLILAIVSLSLLTWIFGLRNILNESPVDVYLMLLGFVSLLYSLFIYLRQSKKIVSYFSFNIWPLLIIAVYIILALPVVGEVPSFDGTNYYFDRISNISARFHYSFSDIKSICLCSHVSYGYGLFVMIGELISPGNVSGLHIVNIILACVSGVSFYKLLRHVFKEAGEPVILLGTAIYLYSPFLLGIVGFINVDTPGVYFFTCLISLCLRNKRLGSLIFAYLFAFTKEPSIVYLAFFASACLIIALCTNRAEGKRLIDKKLIVSLTPYLFVGINWLLVFLGKAYFKTGKNKGASLSWKGSEISEFKIDFNNIRTKTIQIFVMNFNWISVIIIIAVFALCLFTLIKNRDRVLSVFGINSEYAKFNYLCIAVLSGGLLFNYIYFDYLHPRYIQLMSVIVIIMGVAALCRLSLMKKCYIPSVVISLTVLALMLLQTHVSADPLPGKLLICEDQYGNPFTVCSMWKGMGDQTVYNRDYSNYIRCIEGILKKEAYGKDTSVVFDTAENIYYNMDHAFWDTKKGKFSSKKNENTIKLKVNSKSKKIKREIHINNIEEALENDSFITFGGVTVAYHTAYVESGMNSR